MDIDQEIAKLINELGRLSQKERLEKDYGSLTVLNLQLLAYIYFSDRSPKMREIAESIGVSLPSISAMIDRLESDELVKRVHDTKDRRTVQAQLTDKGRHIIQLQIDKSTNTIKDALIGLSDADKQVVLDFFRTYTDNAKKQLAR